MQKNKISSNYTDKEITITIPLDLLIWACENNEDYADYSPKIINRELFAKEMSEEIIEGVQGIKDLPCLTRIQEFLDECWEAVYANGSESILTKEEVE